MGYVALAQVAAHTTVTKLQLKPADAVEIKLFRLFEDTLRFRMGFRAKGFQQRPELGSWAYIKKDGFLELRPGAEVRIVATTPDSSPLEYAGMPLGGISRDQNWREMSANLPVRPGVYRWPPPPSTPVARLHAGFNTVRFEVISVGAPIVGETVELDALPPLGFKSGQWAVGWLWFGLLWPAFVIAQAIWAAGLLVHGLRRRKPVS